MTKRFEEFIDEKVLHGSIATVDPADKTRPSVEVAERRWPGTTDLLLTLGLFAGIVLRLVQLNAQSFWYDEAFSWQISTKPISEMIPALVADFVQPPLHYFFLHGWFGVVGNDATAARLFVVLFGIATLPAIYWLGRELYDQQTAIIGVVLLAISQLGIAYSQEVRPYSQLMFFTLLTALFYVRAIKRRSIAALFAATVCAVLAFGSHYYAAFVAVGLGVWHMFYARGRLPGSWILLSIALGILVCLPWLFSGVVEAALAAEKTFRVQPSYFRVHWQTPIENLAAFGNARLESVIAPASAQWAYTISAALFSGPVLLLISRPWMKGFLFVVLAAAIGLLSGFWKWSILAILLLTGMRVVDGFNNARLRNLATGAFLLAVLVLSILAELQSVSYSISFLFGLVAAAPLRAWLPQPGSADDDWRRSSLLVCLVALPLVPLLLAETRGVQYDVRYVLASLAPFYLLVARTVTLIRSRVLAGSLLAAMIAFSILGIRTQFEVPYKENYRDALALVHDRYQPGHCVAFAPWWGLPIQWRLYRYDDVKLRSLSETELKDGATTCDEVWLVRYERVQFAVNETVEAALAKRRDLLGAQDFHWVRVAHFGPTVK